MTTSVDSSSLHPPPSSSSSSSSLSSTSHWKFFAQHYLNQYLYETAKFYAERYHIEAPSEESLLLLAQCYYRMGKFKQCYLLLSESKYLNALDNKYLFALVCVQLGKYDEAEFVLHANNRLIVEEDLSKENMSGIPGGAAGLYLMGKICRRQQRKENAIQYFRLALEIDPFFWSAITELCEMGVDFKIDELILSAKESSSSSSSSTINPGSKIIPKSPRMSTRSNTKKHNNNPTTTGAHIANASLISGIADAKAGGLSSLFSEKKDFDNATAKAFLLQTAENLQKNNNNHNSNSLLSGNYPAAPSTTADYSTNSVVSIKLPFATPSSLPSPITASMLSVGGNAVLPNNASMMMMISPYDTYNLPVSDEASGRAPSTIHPHISNVSTGMMNTTDVNPTRASLFGLPTPATNEQPQHGYSISDIPPISASSDFEGEQSTIMEMNSVFHKNAGGGERRRVSFGPTARLSFSGAFDSHLPNPSLSDSFEQSSKIVTAETDDHPHKLQRSDPRKSPSSAARSALLNDRVPPSPFPMSPIQEGNVSLLPDDPSRHHLSASKPYDSLVYDESAIIADPKSSTTPFLLPQPPLPPPAPANSRNNPTSKQRTAAVIGTGSSSSSDKGTIALQDIDESLWKVVAIFARALQQLYSYYCIESIETLQHLPEKHYQSAYVSQLIGKACTEMNEYKGAIIAFREMRRLEPYHTHGIEMFSSALWHLREDKELSALAQQAVEIDKYCPETWCVVGNCFSLQKETDMAIKFFQRALQIDPYFTYANTLCGHEHVNNEDMEKAITSFRTAILCNERHYNAWYGLGSIYYRQERFEMSEYHFRRARSINPRSSVLDCYLGMALNAQGSFSKIQEALQILKEASKRDPNNPQLRFQRAHILLTLDRLNDALEELTLVEQYAPKEAPVHAMLGQIHQRLGHTQEALLHLNIAIDLDPKEINSLKGIMDNFEEPQLVT